jgi:uncharacterized protein (TIGR02996 family)
MRPTPTPRPEVLAFLADVKDHPADDAPRLILADWLDEYGGPPDAARAEFIRTQCALGGLPTEDGRRHQLARRERELRERHQAAWLGPLGRLHSPGHGCSFRRGLAAFTVDLMTLLSKAFAALAATEAWAWVDAVAVRGAHELHGPRLADCPLLADLNDLSFPGGELGAAGVAYLARSPHLGRLTRLGLSDNGLGAAGAAALSRSAGLAALADLDLSRNGVGAEGARALAGAPHLRRLSALTLWDNHLGDEGAAALAAAPHLAGLTALDLRTNLVGDAGARALASSPHLGRLTALNLMDNLLGPASAAALANSPHLGGLASLVLWGNPIGPDGADLLRARFGPRVHVSPVRFV